MLEYDSPWAAEQVRILTVVDLLGAWVTEDTLGFLWSQDQYLHFPAFKAGRQEVEPFSLMFLMLSYLSV